ncbi:hypothetical protein GN956_G25571 [Arapaima gigas]
MCPPQFRFKLFEVNTPTLSEMLRWRIITDSDVHKRAPVVSSRQTRAALRSTWRRAEEEEHCRDPPVLLAASAADPPAVVLFGAEEQTRDPPSSVTSLLQPETSCQMGGGGRATGVSVDGGFSSLERLPATSLSRFSFERLKVSCSTSGR